MGNRTVQGKVRSTKWSETIVNRNERFTIVDKIIDIVSYHIVSVFDTMYTQLQKERI